jgi:hypothetical protein
VRRALCTICSKNYLHFARALMASAERTHPEWDRVVLLADRVDGAFDPARERFRVIEGLDLDLPRPAAFCFRYGILELNTAVKPWLFSRLLGRDGYDRAVYLDPDVRLYRRMDEVDAAFDAGALCVLTPHLTGPIDDGKHPSEVEILRAGTYNLGFLALQRHQELGRLLAWWQARLERGCVVDQAGGLFVDQRWIDLLPGMFEGVVVLRHPGYNVAYWNLPHREVALGEAGATVNGAPLVFFHFSGLDPHAPEGFSKYQDRYRLTTLGPARRLVEDYVAEVIARGLDDCARWPYAFARFASGVEIPDVLRAFLRRHPEVEDEVPGLDPFALDPGFFNAPFRAGDAADPLASRFLRAVWESRPDLQAAFPDPGGVDREALAAWLVERRELDFEPDPSWIRPVAESLRRHRGGGSLPHGGLEPALARARRAGKPWVPDAAKRWLRALAQPPPDGGTPAQRRLRALLRGLPFGLERRVRALILPPGAVPPERSGRGERGGS